jgi:2-iminobutanoate/2-iminopropanoate deaminase
MSVEKHAAVNAIDARDVPEDLLAGIFVRVPAWPGPFDIEVDGIAVWKDDHSRERSW